MLATSRFYSRKGDYNWTLWKPWFEAYNHISKGHNIQEGGFHGVQVAAGDRV